MMDCRVTPLRGGPATTGKWSTYPRLRPQLIEKSRHEKNLSPFFRAATALCFDARCRLEGVAPMSKAGAPTMRAAVELAITARA